MKEVKPIPFGYYRYLQLRLWEQSIRKSNGFEHRKGILERSYALGYMKKVSPRIPNKLMEAILKEMSNLKFISIERNTIKIKPLKMDSEELIDKMYKTMYL